MNRVGGGACLLMLLLCSFAVTSPLADTPNASKRTYVAPRYEVAKEITLEGTIQSIVRRPSPGMMLGDHLILATKLGTIDAHIGPWVLNGTRSRALATGDSVTVVGVMTNFNGGSLLLTRLIQAGSQTILVRNEHGFVLAPGAAERMSNALISGGAR